MFRAFGIGELADKAREDFTSEDVRRFIYKSIESYGISAWIALIVCPSSFLLAHNPHVLYLHNTQGLQALAKFKAFARRAVERLGGVTDQNKLAETMQKYAELIDSDDSLREMAARVEVRN